MRIINILVAVNDSFVMPTRVMLKSLYMNHSSDIKFEVYVLCSNLQEKSVDALVSMNCASVNINFLRVEDALFENVPLYSYFSKEVYYRLTAQDILPGDIERILWLDGDIIINGSLEKFYFQEIGNYMFAVIEDMLNGNNLLIHEKFGIPSQYPYFSSGVMLYNLASMRQNIKVSDIFRFIHENASKLQIVDQDVLNAMFYNRVKVWKSPYTFNYFAAYITRKNYKEILNKIAVVHYCGSKKPWKKNYPYYGFKLFWKYGAMFEEYKDLYKKIKISAFTYHVKWIIYEEMKLFIGRYISMNRLKKLIGKDK